MVYIYIYIYIYYLFHSEQYIHYRISFNIEKPYGIGANRDHVLLTWCSAGISNWQFITERGASGF